MRLAHALVPAILLVILGGCARSRPPPMTPDVPPAPVLAEAPAGRAADDSVPRVVRRIVKEEKDLVERSVALAKALPDARGRERALREAAAIEVELASVVTPLENADSDALDAIVAKLLAIDTRVVLLHEALRTATEHTTVLATD